MSVEFPRAGAPMTAAIRYPCPLCEWHHDVPVGPDDTSPERAWHEHLESHALEEWATRFMAERDAAYRAHMRASTLASMVQKLTAELASLTSRVSPHLPVDARHALSLHVQVIGAEVADILKGLR